MDNLKLVIFFIIKIVVIIIVPIILFLFRKKEIKSYYIWTEILALIAVATLYLIGFSYITESNIITIMNMNMLSDSSIKKVEKNDGNLNKINRNSRIFSTKQIRTRDNTYAYDYEINSSPLNEAELSCDKKSYMKNYGDSMSAITTLIANYYDLDINEMKVLSYLEDNNLVDCENGIDFEKALIKLGDKYYYTVKQISSSQVESYVSSGKSVLVETINNYEEKDNFGCEKDYIVIYNINNEGAYSIVNPNDKKYSYFCPSNTIGYGSIIEGNQNSKSYSLDDIDNKALKYYVIEVK